jgi:hypothetical protein
MSLINREGLFGRVSVGIFAGLVTLVVFNIDQIGFLSAIHSGTSAFNYSVIITMFYILFAMNFMAGLRRRYETSLTYIAFMALYDLATDGLVTIMFAALSFFSLLVGLGVSAVASKLGITGKKEEDES